MPHSPSCYVLLIHLRRGTFRRTGLPAPGVKRGLVSLEARATPSAQQGDRAELHEPLLQLPEHWQGSGLSSVSGRGLFA